MIVALTIASVLGAVVVTAETTSLSWEPRSPYPGPGRHHPITFANETHGFLLTGTTAISSATNDCYMYDASADTWTDLSGTPSAFPGQARSFGYGVVLNEFGNSKAYLGFGASAVGERLNDFWQFDMVTHGWERLASLPGPPRRHPAMNAVLNDSGEWEIHVGLGDGPVNGALRNLGDWWIYNIDGDSWTRQPDLPGRTRHHPFYFAVGSMSYGGLGHGNLGIYRDWYRLVDGQWFVDTSFESYEITNDGTVVSDQPLTTEARVAGTQFAIELPSSGQVGSDPALSGSLGFVLSGDGDDHSTMATGEFHVFYPPSEPDSSVGGRWGQLPPHPGFSRWAPGSFVLRGTARAYFTSGYDREAGLLYKDLWEIDLLPLFSVVDAATAAPTLSPTNSNIQNASSEPSPSPTTTDAELSRPSASPSSDASEGEPSGSFWCSSSLGTFAFALLLLLLA